MIFRRAKQAPPPDARKRVDALLNQSREHNAAGATARVVECLGEAAQIIEQLQRAEPQVAQHDDLLSEVRSTAGVNEASLGRLDAAVQSFDQAAIAARHWSERDTTLAPRLRLAGIAYEAGRTLLKLSREAEAIDQLGQACALYEGLPNELPQKRARLADAYGYLGEAFASCGLRTSAVSSLQLAILHLRSCPELPTEIGQYPAWSQSDRMSELLAVNADVLCAFEHRDLAVNSADAAIRGFIGARLFTGKGAQFFREATRVAALLHAVAGREGQAREAAKLGAESLRPGDGDRRSLTAAAIAAGRSFENVVDPISWSLERALLPRAARIVLQETLQAGETATVVVPIDRVIVRTTDQKAQLAHVARAALAVADASRVEQLLDAPLSARLATESNAMFAAVMASKTLDREQAIAIIGPWADTLLGASLALHQTCPLEHGAWAGDLANCARNVVDKAIGIAGDPGPLRQLSAEVYEHLATLQAAREHLGAS